MCPKDIHILDLLELCAQLPPRSKAVGMKLGQGGQGSLVTSQTSLTGSKSPKLPWINSGIWAMFQALFWDILCTLESICFKKCLIHTLYMTSMIHGKSP
jgi:hypothetical protein